LLVLAAAAVSAGARPASGPTLAQLAGAHVLIRMRGPVPSPALLARIRRGQVGGVVLFSNTIPPEGPRPLVRQLQAVAPAGGRPATARDRHRPGGRRRQAAARAADVRAEPDGHGPGGLRPGARDRPLSAWARYRRRPRSRARRAALAVRLHLRARVLDRPGGGEQERHRVRTGTRQRRRGGDREAPPGAPAAPAPHRLTGR